MNQDPPTPKDYGYAVFVDEAGDPWINRVLPVDRRGSSEWLILSAVVVSQQSEDDIPRWIEDAIVSLGSNQLSTIHFRELTATRKASVTRSFSSLKARYFSIASNKRNMRQYRNPRASTVSQLNGWLYNWMLRLLLERVSIWIYQKSLARGDNPTTKLVIAERGDITHADIANYLFRLELQHKSNLLHIDNGRINWSAIDIDRIYLGQPQMIPGLQIADVVASSFLNAVSHDNGRTPVHEYAMNLAPRLARPSDSPTGRIAGFGLKLMPNFLRARLTADQSQFFRSFGYPAEWWPPHQRRRGPIYDDDPINQLPRARQFRG